MIRIFSWLKQKLFGSPSRLKAVMVDEMPDVLKPEKVYVAGEGGCLWFAAMTCPCGCKQILYMNLNGQSKPCWEITICADGTVTLYPSVWRKIGCKSHFYLRNGRIEWCKTI